MYTLHFAEKLGENIVKQSFETLEELKQIVNESLLKNNNVWTLGTRDDDEEGEIIAFDIKERVIDYFELFSRNNDKDYWLFGWECYEDAYGYSMDLKDGTKYGWSDKKENNDYGSI